jgi:hypothetical protein
MTEEVAVPKVIYRSRWGIYYPCDKQTARCLRRIRGEFEKARKRAAAWNRYYRKAERNRKTPRPELVGLFTKFEDEQYWDPLDVPTEDGIRFKLKTRKRAIVPWHIMCDARLISGTRYSKSEDVPQLPVTKEQVLAFCEELGLSTSVGKVRSAK